MSIMNAIAAPTNQVGTPNKKTAECSNQQYRCKQLSLRQRRNHRPEVLLIALFLVAPFRERSLVTISAV
jgi:hypothetical protein